MTVFTGNLCTGLWGRYTPVFTGLVHGPWVRRVNTGVILDTCEHGQSRSAGAIFNDVIVIFYLQDGCPKWHPCSRAVFTGREHEQCVPILTNRLLNVFFSSTISCYLHRTMTDVSGKTHAFTAPHWNNRWRVVYACIFPHCAITGFFNFTFTFRSVSYWARPICTYDKISTVWPWSLAKFNQR